MRDAEKSKRPPFQVHLSTMIIASFLAGGIIYADILYYNKEMHLGEKADPERLAYYRARRSYVENETFRLALFEGGCLILFVVGCEQFIRRREGCKP